MKNSRTSVVIRDKEPSRSFKMDSERRASTQRVDNRYFLLSSASLSNLMTSSGVLHAFKGSTKSFLLSW